jgi:hypothetical protein
VFWRFASHVGERHLYHWRFALSLSRFDASCDGALQLHTQAMSRRSCRREADLLNASFKLCSTIYSSRFASDNRKPQAIYHSMLS